MQIDTNDTYLVCVECGTVFAARERSRPDGDRLNPCCGAQKTALYPSALPMLFLEIVGRQDPREHDQLAIGVVFLATALGVMLGRILWGLLTGTHGCSDTVAEELLDSRQVP